MALILNLCNKIKHLSCEDVIYWNYAMSVQLSCEDVIYWNYAISVQFSSEDVIYWELCHVCTLF